MTPAEARSIEAGSVMIFNNIKVRALTFVTNPSCKIMVECQGTFKFIEPLSCILCHNPKDFK